MTRPLFTLLASALALAALRVDSALAQAAGFDLERSDIRAFIDEVAKRHSLDRTEVRRLLLQAEPQPKIIELITRPAERVIPWWEYRERFLTEERINAGVKFWQEHREILDRIAAETGVAPEYVVAIIGVETFFGRITGRYRVLDALATLAFDYPPRSKYFRSELEQFLLLAREESVDPLTALGSYAGAMGAPQFMPSSYRRYAVDGGSDSRRNLWSDWDDVIASVANYFREHGWQRGGPVVIEAKLASGTTLDVDTRNLDLDQTLDSLKGRGVRIDMDLPGSTPALLVAAERKDGPAYRVGFKNFQVITRYNRSTRYAMAVHDLAQAIAHRVHAGQT